MKHISPLLCRYIDVDFRWTCNVSRQSYDVILAKRYCVRVPVFQVNNNELSTGWVIPPWELHFYVQLRMFHYCQLRSTGSAMSWTCHGITKRLYCFFFMVTHATRVCIAPCSQKSIMASWRQRFLNTALFWGHLIPSLVCKDWSMCWRPSIVKRFQRDYITLTLWSTIAIPVQLVQPALFQTSKATVIKNSFTKFVLQSVNVRNVITDNDERRWISFMNWFLHLFSIQVLWCCCIIKPRAFTTTWS